jgi:competence protein ComEC
LNLNLIAILCTAIISLLLIKWRNGNYSVVKIQSYLIVVLIVLIGIFYPAKVQNRILPSFDHKDYFLAEVCQKPSEKAKTYQTVLRIQNKLLTKPEKVIAYFSKEKYDSTLTTGDQIIILSKPQLIRNMGNPYELDYQFMLNSKDIWFSVYLTKEVYLKTTHKSDRINYLAEKIRDRLIARLTNVIPEKEERSVVSALTLGYRTEISQETTDYFASTGAMHVLSVSGLHVALIYFVLGFFLAFIKRGEAGTVIFAFLMILFLWIYAFISGFSPSVQRATVMFSFVIIGNLLRRPANIYNTLMASALFLILLSPQVIYDIGFQLSYLAVFGIILIQPVLNKLIEVTNPILKWIWSLTTVSVAAQLTTFPLGLFYFNQFPNFFWLSNFVVIPATTLIIWLSIAFFVLSPFHSISLFLGMVIQKITHLMLDILRAIDAWPFAVSQGIVLNPVQVLLLFSIITAIIVFAASKRNGWLLTALILIISFQGVVLFEDYRVFNQKSIIIYNSKNLMIHLIDGRNNYLVTSNLKSLTESEKKIIEKVNYHLKLNPTQFVSLEGPNPIKIDEININDNQIHFLRSEILIGNKNVLAAMRDQINLILYPGKKSEKTMERMIYTGNSGSFGIKHPELFRTKLNGAFVVNLNN